MQKIIAVWACVFFSSYTSIAMNDAHRDNGGNQQTTIELSSEIECDMSDTINWIILVDEIKKDDAKTQNTNPQSSQTPNN